MSVVYDCYSKFRTTVDARWYFTEDNFKKSGKDFHDAIAELGFPPNWIAGVKIGPDAWRAVRSLQLPCLVNDLFHQLLGKTIPDPDDPLSAE